MSKKSDLIFVVGPTASGKSKLALSLAEDLKSELINCDSVQVFKNIDIGSAKPSTDELKRVPHHLYSFVNIDKTYSVSEYYHEAHNKITELEEKSINPIIFVGGSGFYFQSLEFGMFEIAAVSDEIKSQVKSELESSGVNAMHAQLLEVDPDSANNISENDSYRVGRAIEVYRATGKTMSQHKLEFEESNAQKEKRNIIKVGLNMDRELLREVVRLRTLQMFELGLLNEVEQLLNKGFENSFVLSCVGYKEVVSHLNGHLTEDEMFFEINKNTMRLAKRQMTWFKRDKAIHWLDSAKDFSNNLNEVKDLITQKLS